MKILNFKDFMKKNLKFILRMRVIYEEFIIIIYTPEIRKYILIKDL